MTRDEIQALVNLQESIVKAGDALDAIQRMISIDIRVTMQGGNQRYIPFNMVDGLSEHFEEILETSFDNLYNSLISKRDQIVLCKEGHATNFTPIEILEPKTNESGS